MWVDENSDEARVLKAYRKLPKSKQKSLLESWSDFLNWVTSVLYDVINIIDIALRIWNSL